MSYRCPTCGRALTIANCVACAADNHRTQSRTIQATAGTIDCQHPDIKKHGFDRKGRQRWRCLRCGAESKSSGPDRRPFAHHRIRKSQGFVMLEMLAAGHSARAVSRATNLKADTVCDVLLTIGERCAAAIADDPEAVPPIESAALARSISIAVRFRKTERHRAAALAFIRAWHFFEPRNGADFVRLLAMRV